MCVEEGVCAREREREKRKISERTDKKSGHNKNREDININKNSTTFHLLDTVNMLVKEEKREWKKRKRSNEEKRREERRREKKKEERTEVKRKE